MKTSPISLLVFITTLVLSLTACQKSTQEPPTPAGTYPVDPIFQSFYKKLGGQSTLGPAITPVLSENGLYYQYTSSALMEYDSQAPEDSRVRLFPLGREMGVSDRPQLQPTDAEGRYVDGYRIFDKFVPLFDRLGGVSVTGKPLSEAHWNVGKNRYEQYFENIGFYWLDGDADNAVYLLAYGDWKCEQQCDSQPNSSAIIEIPSGYVTPIRHKAESLGLAFTGLPLTAPSLAADGRVEQVFETVVMATDVQTPNDVRLLPLPEVVGILREPPNVPNPAPSMVFVPTEGDLGYNVPFQFEQFINAHGGYAFTGQPITHVSRPESTILEQCFTNMCLRGELSVEGYLDVSPIPLGYEYREAFVERRERPLIAEDITIRTWESKPLVAPQEDQELGVIVLSSGQPAEGVAIELKVQRPDGEERAYQLPPTDEFGETKLRLDPMNAENGTLVPYTACAQILNQQKFCVLDSFVIWDIGTIEITPTLPPNQTSYLPFVMRNLHLFIPAFINHYLTYMPFVGNER